MTTVDTSTISATDFDEEDKALLRSWLGRYRAPDYLMANKVWLKDANMLVEKYGSRAFDLVALINREQGI